MHTLLILFLIAGFSRGPQSPLPPLSMRIDSADRLVRTTNIVCDTESFNGTMNVVYFPVMLGGIPGILSLHYDSTLYLTSGLWTTANPETHGAFAYMVSHNPNSYFAKVTKSQNNNATQKQFNKLRAFLERINGPAEPHSETTHPESDLMWESGLAFKALRMDRGFLEYWF